MRTGKQRVRVTELNPNLICVLCSGYFIDATTLTECLHSFCKTCIVKYLESSKHCPVCDVMVHKTRPHLHIRSDKTLQDLVYKIVPGLYKTEMKRRRDFYTENPQDAPSKVGEERGDENAERILYTEDEKFSVSLHFCSVGIRDERSVRTLTLPEMGAASKMEPKDVRYLQCPAGVTVEILKKFVRFKYELPRHYQIDIFHSDELLPDDYTLMDVAYIYTWRRKQPLKMNFSVFENLVKRRKLESAVNTRLLDFKKMMKQESKRCVKQETAISEIKTDLEPREPSLSSDSDQKAGKKADQKCGERVEMIAEKKENINADSTKTVAVPVVDSTSSSLFSKSSHQMDSKLSGNVDCDKDRLVRKVATATKPDTSDQPSEKQDEKPTVGLNSYGNCSVEHDRSVLVETSRTVKAVAVAAPTSPVCSTSGSTTVVSADGSKKTFKRPLTTPTSLGMSPAKKKTTSNASNTASKVTVTSSSVIGTGTSKTPDKNRNTMQMDTTKAPESIRFKDGSAGKTKPSADCAKALSVCSQSSSSEGSVHVYSVQTQPVVTVRSLCKAKGQTLGSQKEGITPTLPVNSAKITSGQTLDIHREGEVPLLPVSNAPTILTTPGNKVTKALKIHVQPTVTATPAVSKSNSSAVVSSRVNQQPHTVTKVAESGSPLKPRPALPSLGSKVLPSPGSVNSVPSAAAAAGAASPSPAALAASSSPSPPMASSAASVRELMEPPHKRSGNSSSDLAPSSNCNTSSTVVVDRASSTPLTTAVLSTVTSVKTVCSVSSPKVVESLPSPVHCSSGTPSSPVKQNTTTSGDVPTVQKLVTSHSSVTSCDSHPVPAVSDKKITTPSCSVAAGVTDDSKITPSQPDQAASSSKSKPAVSPHSESTVKQVGAEKTVTDVSRKVDNSATGKVSMGNNTPISSLTKGLLSSRNGMPTVVTKPTRVNNAATSVNTLIHRLPATTTQQTMAASKNVTNPVFSKQNGTVNKTDSKPPPLLYCGPKPAGAPEAVLKQGQSTSSGPSVSSTGPSVSSTRVSKEGGKAIPAMTSAVNAKKVSRRAGTDTQSSSSASGQSLQSGSQQSKSPSSSSHSPSRAVGSSPSIQPGTWPSSSSTPVPIQPMSAMSGAEGVTGTAVCSRSSVVMARRASQFHTMAQQAKEHQQRKMLELQLLQQQHLLGLRAVAAFAAGYNPLLLSSAAHLQVPLAAPTQPLAPVLLSDGIKKPGAESGKKTPQANAGGRKSGDASPKKKITDIANTLRKKINQTQGTNPRLLSGGSTNNADKRPPHAHSAPQQTDKHASAGTGINRTSNSKVSTASSCKGEDEPLNLVVTRDDSDTSGTHNDSAPAAAR